MKSNIGKIADSRQLAVGSGQKAVSGENESPLTAHRSPLTESGFTLLELIITLAIIAVLAAGTVPVARNMIKREKEMELRRNLREIRKAIDAYKRFCDSGNVSPLDKKVDDECYPPELQTLVDGIRPPNKVDEIRRFLRHIPNDPFTGKPDWGLRSVQDDSDSTSWGGQNVYDVYSKASGTALDDSKYSDW